MRTGYIKLHRKLLDWGWYSDPATKCVFLHLLITATWVESEYLGYKLHPGDAVVGRKRLAGELGLTEQQVRTALNKLEATGEIRKKATNRFTIVTVVKWRDYQLIDEESNQQITNKQPTSNQQITTLKEDKEDKEDKKDIYNRVISLFNDICSSMSTVQTVNLSRKRAINKVRDKFSAQEIEKAFRKAEASDFLSGRSGKWKASFDWIMKPEHMTNILEGVYDNASPQGPDPVKVREAKKRQEEEERRMVAERNAELAAIPEEERRRSVERFRHLYGQQIPQ